MSDNHSSLWNVEAMRHLGELRVLLAANRKALDAAKGQGAEIGAAIVFTAYLALERKVSELLDEIPPWVV